MFSFFSFQCKSYSSRKTPTFQFFMNVVMGMDLFCVLIKFQCLGQVKGVFFQNKVFLSVLLSSYNIHSPLLFFILSSCIAPSICFLKASYVNQHLKLFCQMVPKGYSRVRDIISFYQLRQVSAFLLIQSSRQRAGIYQKGESMSVSLGCIP